MDTKMYGYMFVGAVLWAVGAMLLVQAFSMQWTGGMSGNVFLYYLVGFVVIGIGFCTCCMKCCMDCMIKTGKDMPEKKAA